MLIKCFKGWEIEKLVCCIFNTLIYHCMFAGHFHTNRIYAAVHKWSFLRKNKLDALKSHSSQCVNLQARSVHVLNLCAHVLYVHRSVCSSIFACIPGGESPTLFTNASLWLWINNSESWHSWVEPLLFMVGSGIDRWLFLILRSSRDSPPPWNQGVFITFMSVSFLQLYPPLICVPKASCMACACSQRGTDVDCRHGYNSTGCSLQSGFSS